MAEVINMPRLSDTMEEGTVAKWLKKVGDTVKEGDLLAEIETDKATMEFEAFQEGELLYIGVPEGGNAPVDSLLAIIGEKGEDISKLVSGSSSAKKSSENADQADTPVAPSKMVEMPEGVQVIAMPRLSDTMEEGTVAKWLKKVGDMVKEGDILAEIETDKTTMEFESFYSGTLLHIGVEQGQSTPVDGILAVIGPHGTDVESVLAAHAPVKTPENRQDNANVLESAVATESKIASATETTSTSVTDSRRIFASPLAKRLALEKGVDLRSIQGTGENGRIIKRDIESYQPGLAGNTKVFVPKGVESITEIANSQMRKVIAKRLSTSKFTAPHYYLGVEYDMNNAIAFRNQYNTLPDTKISFNDIVIKACALALKHHPQVNAKWEDDRIVQHHHVHIGVAVAVEDGLVVPVLKFSDEQSLPQIGAVVKGYASRARSKKLTPGEMEGSTFTISNLGMFGIQEFTSIINQPNSAILSVGAIVQKPIVKNGSIVIGNTMKLTLACDHRVVDGVTGAEFLETLRSYIENPITLLT